MSTTNLLSFDTQVISGGQYDVDVEMVSPAAQVIYSQMKNQYDSHTFTTEVSIT